MAPCRAPSAGERQSETTPASVRQPLRVRQSQRWSEVLLDEGNVDPGTFGASAFYEHTILTCENGIWWKSQPILKRSHAGLSCHPRRPRWTPNGSQISVLLLDVRGESPCTLSGNPVHSEIRSFCGSVRHSLTCSVLHNTMCKTTHSLLLVSPKCAPSTLKPCTTRSTLPGACLDPLRVSSHQGTASRRGPSTSTGSKGRYRRTILECFHHVSSYQNLHLDCFRAR